MIHFIWITYQTLHVFLQSTLLLTQSEDQGQPDITSPPPTFVFLLDKWKWVVSIYQQKYGVFDMESV